MSDEDYYKILNVNKSASNEEIKQAFKKLAREHHPDKGGKKETFQNIQKAYETLSDPQKRRAYDSPQPEFPFEFGGFNHSFFQTHHQQQPRQNVSMANHYYVCRISLKDVYFGTVKRIKVTRERLCLGCVQTCPACNGSGSIKRAVQIGPFTQIMNHNCNKCGGTGDFFNSATFCTKCHSKTKILEERIIEITIHKGVEHGKQYIFEDWGQQAKKSSDIPGHLVVTVEVEPHPLFLRQGIHLTYTTKLTLAESIIGKSIAIDHFDGQFVVDTAGFGIINPNKQYSIFERGISLNGTRGNLNIIFQIDYPVKTLNANELEVMRNALEQLNL